MIKTVHPNGLCVKHKPLLCSIVHPNVSSAISSSKHENSIHLADQRSCPVPPIPPLVESELEREAKSKDAAQRLEKRILRAAKWNALSMEQKLDIIQSPDRIARTRAICSDATEPQYPTEPLSSMSPEPGVLVPD